MSSAATRTHFAADPSSLSVPFERSYDELRTGVVNRVPSLERSSFFLAISERWQILSDVAGKIRWRTVGAGLALGAAVLGLATILFLLKVDLDTGSQRSSVSRWLGFTGDWALWLDEYARWPNGDLWLLTYSDLANAITIVMVIVISLAVLVVLLNSVAKFVGRVIRDVEVTQLRQLATQGGALDIYVGSGEMRIGVGGRGLGIQSNRLRYYLDWWGIAEDRIAARNRGFPPIDVSLVERFTPQDIFFGRIQDQRFNELERSLAKWAQAQRSLRLPLKRQTAADDEPEETLLVDRDYFQNPTSSELTWERFVTIACLMALRVRQL